MKYNSAIHDLMIALWLPFPLTALYYHFKDAYMLSLDQKGFDILGKVPGPALQDGSRQYQWRDFRFSFKEEALDIESFCRQLVEMEEEAIKKVSTYTGLGWVGIACVSDRLQLWKGSLYPSKIVSDLKLFHLYALFLNSWKSAAVVSSFFWLKLWWVYKIVIYRGRLQYCSGHSGEIIAMSRMYCWSSACLMQLFFCLKRRIDLLST